MDLKEHENNHFTKEKNEIEKYLLRIIQRYFDIENNFTKESIEAMIIESLTRFKQSIINEKGFIFSFNKQTGKIMLTIRDFNGELAFNKNTAFNKDFGTEADTICEGNDERLSDDREPLEHTHKIADINGLKEELEKINVSTESHTHNNKTVLDVLNYTGTQVQIDLVIIEYLQRAVNDYYSNLQLHQRELRSLYIKNIENLDAYIQQLEQILQDIQDLSSDTVTWLQDAYNHTDSSVALYKTNVQQKLSEYALKEQTQKLIDFLKKPYYVISDGEINITDGDISFASTETQTNITETKVTKYTIPSSVMNEANNTKIKLFFKYDKDGKTVTAPLPFSFKNEYGNNTIIQGNYTKTGEITIASNFINSIPFLANESQLYDTDTLIVYSDADKKNFYFTNQYLKSINCKLCLIDSNEKNNFVANILPDNIQYLIDGDRSFVDLEYYNISYEKMSYFNWADGNPNSEEAYTNIVITSDSQWHSVNCNEPYGFVAEYSIQKLTQYFENPRIYYQILGNKEVI